MNFFIYSFDHQAWWRAKAMGYTGNRDEAGIFTAEETQELNLDGFKPGDTPRGDVLVRVD